MKKNLVVLLLLLAFSLIHPVLFYYYEGQHVKVTPSTYKVRDNSHNYTAEIEKFAQLRIVYQAYENIKLHRVFALSTIDGNNALNSYPLYQYYNFGISHLLGLMMFIVPDVVVVYAIGLWVFSLLFVFGLYRVIMKICGSKKTAFLFILVALTYPYFLVNLLTRYATAEYCAVSMVPMLIYLVIELLELGTRLRGLRQKQELAQYVFLHSVFILLGSLFIVTHNITTLYTVVFLGIPLLIYILRTIKPSIKAILLLIIPLPIIILNGMFILGPIVQNQSHLLISDTFSGLLFQNFRLNDSSVVFKIFPFSSPYSGMPYLNLQLGVPIILLAFIFFRPKSFHIYILCGLILWLIIAPTLWHLLPPIFYVTQFSMRLFTYLPLVLLFAVRPISKFAFVTVTAITIFIGFFFFQRPNSPNSFYTNNYDVFPSENHWNYMQKGENPTIPAPVAVDPPGDTIIPKEISSHSFLIDSISNHDYKRKAVTYIVTLSDSTSKELFHSSIHALYKDGSYADDPGEYTPIMNTIVLSYCTPNTSDLSVFFKTPHSFKGTLSVKKLAETQYLYMGNELIASSCDYEYKNNGQEYLFKLDEKFASTQLLTIFYSPYNVVTGEDGKVLVTKPFLDASQRSHTVVMNRGNNKIIRVQLSTGNIWIPISLLSFKVTILLFIAASSFLIAARMNMRKKQV